MIVDRTWEDADSVGLALLVRRFEAAWRSSEGGHPDPADFLPAGSGPDVDFDALLALLRADLALRREAAEPLRVEEYRDRFPELGGTVLVALLYEEFCLREEAGERPEMAEYEARFPEAAVELRQVLEIHSLVRSGRSVLPGPGPPAAPFPHTGQTIAGFRLVEELGRGAFARVFRAEERLLANRLVALKVSRAASREPQALARLQHTHIVPVHSYRTDPVTGLHLLCMPYLGRVTLADVLAHPRARSARAGADLLAALDLLGAADDAPGIRPAGRRALARLGHARAVAWWGARLAEALQHAHDRGILHRDIKPSNVLITGDGLPMLLDFNLAQESWIEDPAVAPAALGGTLAYMAPEHLEALADGTSDRVDGRADLYALGVVLFEALAGGTRPFAPPTGVTTIPEILRRAATERQARVPRLRSVRPDIPPELEVVVRRCLAPDPDDRYASASELAADLQAVADDAPLRFAPEPLVGRLCRWVRRNRRRLVLAAPPVLVLAALAFTLVESRIARLRLEVAIGREISEGVHAEGLDQLDRAADRFATAARLASSEVTLRPLRDRALTLHDAALRAREVRDRADELFRRAESLRFALLGFGGNPDDAERGVENALRLFSVLDDGWAARPELRLLDQRRRARLLAEADELLFLWAVVLDRGRPGNPTLDRKVLRICDAARPFATPDGPWAALRERYDARREGRPPTTFNPDSRAETSARACFEWGLLRRLEGRFERSIAWLERAVQLRPDDYWLRYYLGYRYDRAGQFGRAIEHYDVAVALRPSAPWALKNRAHLYAQQGDWDRARDDLDQALTAARASRLDFPEARLESGVVREYLGDLAGARADYEAVIAVGGPLARAAVLNRAKLDLNAGAADRARAAYDAMRADDPVDPNERLGRALLALRLGQAEPAEDDLTRLLHESPGSATVHAHRALARLALGRARGAADDAGAALRLQPGPGHERLWIRSVLAAGRDGDLSDLLSLDDPDAIDFLPAAGPALTTDLNAVAERLRVVSESGGPLALPALRTRAVLLSARHNPAAVSEADRTLALSPHSPDAYLIRARIRRRTGDFLGALTDVERGLSLAPGIPHLLEFRGLLLIELGRPEAALADLDRAHLRGTRGTVHASRARALMALGQVESALGAWKLALDYDPEDPHAYLGRARAFVRLRRWDHALADLEQSAGWSRGRARLLAQITWTYAACLPARPDRISRVLGLGRQAVTAWLEALRP